MSGEYILFIAAAFIWIGWKNLQLSNEIEEINEAIETQNKLITCMAEELSKLGSPNVKESSIPAYNIKYE